MKSLRNFLIAGMMITPALLFTACEKDEDKTPEVINAEEEALSSLIFDDVYAEVEDAMEFMEGAIYDQKKSAVSVTCKTITVEHPDDSTFWPRTVTIDYGEGCVGPNGRVRKGKIITVVNGRYRDEGYFRTSTFEDFYIDGFKVEGTKTVENMGFNEAQNIWFEVKLTGGKVTSPEGNVTTREFERIREWVSGYSTPRFRADDEYMVTGIASGVNRKGQTYTNTITIPLQIALNCRWIKSGAIEMVVGDRSEVVLDYGDGACDNQASVSYNGKTWNIKLHR